MQLAMALEDLKQLSIDELIDRKASIEREMTICNTVLESVRENTRPWG